MVHILDDFLMVSIDHAKGILYKQAWRTLCNDIGFPMAEEKYEGPNHVLVFAGIELSTITMTAQLPIDKLRKYSETIVEFSEVRKVKRKDMQSIIGCLQFATSVCVPERAFIRRLIDQTIGIKVPYHYVTVNEEAKKDLHLW